jgi:hypothetical protein
MKWRRVNCRDQIGAVVNCIQVLVGNVKERAHLENKGADGRIILNCVIRK